jgi:chemotaxis response regulator CheB
MPCAAIETGDVDDILALDDIGAALTQLITRREHRAAGP